MLRPLHLVAVAVVVAAVATAWLWMRDGDVAPSSSTPEQTRAFLGACDGQADPPPLPNVLSPVTADLPGVMQALDLALTDAHKTWLRCFELDDELIGATQHGFARWLRTKLRLWGTAPLRDSLQVRSPETASAIIVIAYAHHLRGESLTVAQATARHTAALAVIGVSR